MNSQPKVDENLERFLAEYDEYKLRNTDSVDQSGLNPGDNKINYICQISNICIMNVKFNIFFAAYKFSSDLEFVRIYFDTSMFSRITKER